MTPIDLDQLKKEADERFDYPFEKWIERIWPAADTLTDTVLAYVLMSEDMAEDSASGKEKRQWVLNAVELAIEGTPLHPLIKGAAVLLLRGVVSTLIERLVSWLNDRFAANGGNWKGLADMATAKS